MKRRDFLKSSVPASLGMLFLNSQPIKSFATPKMLPLLNCQGINDRVLVVVFLKGGNDGANTLIPVNQYATYKANRPDVAINESGTGAYIPLDTTMSLPDQIGIHPSMGGFKSLYDASKAQIIRSVGYPDSNGSHFKSTDLWLSGGDGTPANFNLNSGWMGRFLSATYPGLYGNPNTNFEDPLGIQLGDRKPSVGYLSNNGSFVASNLTQQDPGGYYNLVQSIGTPQHTSIPSSDYGNEIAYIMSVENSTSVYAQRITNVFNAGSNASASYPTSGLGQQLKTVARLLAGGSKTKIFLLHTNGFDTHGAQVFSGSPHLGTHANLLTNVFDSIKSFQDDLQLLGLDDKVLTTTFSEFGRRMTQNGSLGTDHGNYAPMFLFGNAITPGVIGTNPDHSAIDANGYLNANQMQFDYRDVYKTLLQDWLGGSNSTLVSTKFDTYNKIPNMLNTNFVTDPSCYVDTYITQIQVRARVMLEGHMEETGNLMRTELGNLIPLSHPYTGGLINHTGTESVDNLPASVCDWVLAELRAESDINTVIARRACFLRSDGELVDLNGVEGIVFKDVPSGNYYLAIYHRSHVAVVSSVTVDSNDAAPYDFTTAATQAMGSNQLKLINGKYTLFAGDFNSNGLNDQTDYSLWEGNSAKVKQYLTIDADGNGVVNQNDYNLWKRNKNQTGHVSIQK